MLGPCSDHNCHTCKEHANPLCRFICLYFTRNFLAIETSTRKAKDERTVHVLAMAQFYSFEISEYNN